MILISWKYLGLFTMVISLISIELDLREFLYVWLMEIEDKKLNFLYLVWIVGCTVGDFKNLNSHWSLNDLLSILLNYLRLYSCTCNICVLP